MEKVEVTRTELVWTRKYSGAGTLEELPRDSMPFQVVETFNESCPMR
jgi:hypothetical protein